MDVLRNFVLATSLIWAIYHACGLDPSGIDALTMIEICENAIDDDGDGLIDLQDPDCECPVLEPISRIPNPSFEERTCCPNSRSSLHCAETWIQASGPTTDYLHTCGWMGWEQFPPPLPFPDGDGVVGFRDGRVIQGISEPTWKEYAGACLLAPLEADVEYRFEFFIGFADRSSSPPINVTFFGNTDCNNLPFGLRDDQLGCPTNDTTSWVRLGSVMVSGTRQWRQVKIDVKPDRDIHAIAIGPECNEPVRSNSTYYFFDNLVLDETRAFDFQISARTHPCASPFVMGVPEVTNATYQWYKDGIAVVGATSSTWPVTTGEGNYQVRIQTERECKITRVFPFQIPKYQTQIEDYICLGDTYDFNDQSISKAGVYQAQLLTPDNCDSLVELSMQVIPPLTTPVFAKIFEGDDYPIGDQSITENGYFEVPLISSLGCDSTVALTLDYYKVFIPSAFSPNGDGVNDYFSVFGEPDLEVIKSLSVFSRWGELIYQGIDLVPNQPSAGWNGQAQQQDMPSGTYVYTTKVQMADGQQKVLNGAVALIR